MTALTLYQPYATAIAVGVKHFETRGFRPSHRGPIAIHAAKQIPKEAHDFAMSEIALGRLPKRLPLGAIVCIADLIDVRPAADVAVEISAVERMYGDYSNGRWAWKLGNVRVLQAPVCIAGKQGLWEWQVNLSSLKFYATGGIVTRPTLASSVRPLRRLR